MSNQWYIFKIGNFRYGFIQNNTNLTFADDISLLSQLYRELIRKSDEIYQISFELWNYLVFYSSIKKFDFENTKELQYFLKQ